MIKPEIIDFVKLPEIISNHKPFMIKCPKCKSIHHYTLDYPEFECICGYKDKIDWRVLFTTPNSKEEDSDKIKKFMEAQLEINKEIAKALWFLYGYTNARLSFVEHRHLTEAINKQEEIINE